MQRSSTLATPNDYENDWNIYSNEELSEEERLAALARLRKFFNVDPKLDKEKAAEKIVELIVDSNVQAIIGYAEENRDALFSSESRSDKGKEKESKPELDVKFYFKKAKSKALYHCLDEAWSDHNNQSLNNTQRNAAFIFICYVLNVNPKAEKAREKINELMADRINYKNNFPEYIPGRNVRRAKLNKLGAYPKKAFNKKEFLEIDQKKRTLDAIGKVPYLDANIRARYNLVISNGLFTQHGETVDTLAMISHGKIGFGALTIDPFGEINLFPHFQGELFNVDISTSLVHASMSQGNWLTFAGEVQIVAGKLVAITTYSGHYNPSLYNIYRALQYFESQGVDISNTAIYLMSSPDSLGMPFASDYKVIPQNMAIIDQDKKEIVLKEKQVDPKTCSWYRVSSASLLGSIKKDLLHSITKLELSLKNARGKNKEFAKVLGKLQALKINLNQAVTFNTVDDIRSEFKLLSEKIPPETLPIRFFNHRSVKNKEMVEKFKSELSNNIDKLEGELSGYLKRPRFWYVIKDCLLGKRRKGLTSLRKKLAKETQKKLLNMRKKTNYKDLYNLNLLCKEFDELLESTYAANEKLSEKFRKTANSGKLSQHLNNITPEKDTLTRSKLLF